MKIKVIVKTAFLLACEVLIVGHENKKPVCISLGYNCECASQLEKVHLRPFAGPFDWVVCPNFSTMCELIENGFKGFFDLENLVLINETKAGKQHYANNAFALSFLHEFSREYPLEKTYQEIKSKYDRRIQKFYDVLNSHDSVIFFRTYRGDTRGLSKNEAEQFCLLLHKLFPKLNFMLVAISNTDKESSWDLPHVRQFYLTERVWPLYHEVQAVAEWKVIFYALGLIDKSYGET